MAFNSFNGISSSESGAALRLISADALIHNNSFTEVDNSGYDTRGGAIYKSGGDLVSILDNTFSHCRSFVGGAVAYEGGLHGSLLANEYDSNSALLFG